MKLQSLLSGRLGAGHHQEAVCCFQVRWWCGGLVVGCRGGGATVCFFGACQSVVVVWLDAAQRVVVQVIMRWRGALVGLVFPSGCSPSAAAPGYPAWWALAMGAFTWLVLTGRWDLAPRARR